MSTEDKEQWSEDLHMIHSSDDGRSKESSLIQALGYVPTPNIANQEWEDMLKRNGEDAQG